MITKKHRKDIITPNTKRTDTIQSVTGDILGSIVQGMTFGAGSAIGNRAVSAMFDKKPDEINEKKSYDMKTCINIHGLLQYCMQNNELDKCKDILKEFENCYKIKRSDSEK